MSTLLLSAVLSTACATFTPTLNDAQITKAITMIALELESRHNEQRCWEPEEPSNGWLTKYQGGTTALTTLAMLSGGYSINTPCINSSLAYLENIEQPSTYVLATRTSIWASMPERYKKNLKSDTKQLLRTMGLRAGSWGNYDSPPKTKTSASPLNREFGMIALRDASRSGQRISKKYWVALANATLLTQHENGGWSYDQGKISTKPTSNMTVAALNCLLGVDEMEGRSLAKKDAQWLHSAIEEGISWLNKHAKTTKNVGGTTLMSYLYGLERAAMSCGLAEIRKRDWFLDGAKAILKTHCGIRKAKGSTVNLSFALLFLSRGRVPIALCELASSKSVVDPLRTSEIITHRVSQQTERALSWQIVTNNETIEAWKSSHLLFIQDTNALPTDTAKLKQYLDEGGLIVMVGTAKDAKVFTEVANTLCPNASPEKISNEHWSLSLLHTVKSANVTAWHDGIRDRILLIKHSPKKLASSEKSNLSKLLVNICCGAAELNRWKARLAMKNFADSRKTVWVAEHEGNWDAELLGIQKWKYKTAPISELKRKNLILVGGVFSTEATEVLAQEVIRLANLGSTVLVESIGGQDAFASTLQDKIEAQIDVAFTTSKQFSDLRALRGWSIKIRNTNVSPLIASMPKGDIYIVDCDLRNGLLEQTCWGVHGYTADSAVHIIDTLLEE
jgi:hypothetical protein